MKSRLSPLCKAALVAASLFLAPQGMAADGQDGIVVYNAQHENLVKSWVDGFTKETGIKVTLRNGDDSELGNQLVQERRRVASRCVSDRELTVDGAG